MSRLPILRGILVILVVLASLVATAGCAPATASAPHSRSVIDSGGIVAPEELRIGEYLAYYKQSFPSPINSTLGLDLRLGNTQVPVEGGPVWLQIGAQARAAESETIAPLNLAIVVDRSGSMNAPEKMPYLKQSLKVFLGSLAPNDLVALVAFSDQAEVIRSATPVGDGAWIEAAVERLQPGGNTNLNDGLTTGLKEVDRNFDVRRNNRVILLTDGVANQGVTDPQQIARTARDYNDKGIYLSTVGLGKNEYNDALLNELATQGKGAYHFVDSAAEMDKIFHQDVSGLIQKAASDVAVTVRPADGVSVESITGYDGHAASGPVELRLRDMGTGDSQVALVSLNVEAGGSGVRALAEVELRYQDLFAQREATIKRTISADAGRLNAYDPAWDAEVLRNVTIQRTAEGMKEIGQLYQAQRYTEAWQLAYRLEQDLRTAAAISDDPQLVKDADTMRRYEDTLAKWAQRQTGRLPRPQEQVTAPQPARGRGPARATSIPTVEVR